MQKIPKKIVSSLDFNQIEKVVLRGSRNEDFHGDLTLCSDGRILLSINAWENFVKAENLEVGQVLMFLFHATLEERCLARTVTISIDKI